MVDVSKDTICTTCKLRSPIFKNLTEEELAYFRKISHEAIFNAGEIIFKQGAPLTHIICVSKGSAKKYVELSDSRNILLRVLLAKNIAGVSGINTDNKHHFSLAALEPTTTCFIEIDAFKKVIQQNPVFSYDMIGIINNLHTRLFEKLKNLTQKNLNGKVADTLLYLANEVYNCDKFETLLLRQDIADMSVTTRESTIRALKEFKEQGIINFRENYFEILRKEILDKISKFG